MAIVLEALMPSKPSIPAEKDSLRLQVTALADQPFLDLSRALLKASFLFSNHPERAIHAYHLSLAQMDVLTVLADAVDSTVTCSEIAEKTLITKGGITGILDRLEARGLVKRMPSRDDRRRVQVRLSAKGIELLRKLYPELARSNRALFERALRPEQMREFAKALDLLIRGLEGQRES
jgi:MarR family transcriptional regulator, 2-MHQ and catechol-resistance regulon repressor